MFFIERSFKFLLSHEYTRWASFSTSAPAPWVQQTSHVPNIASSLRSDIDIFHHLKHVKHLKHVNYLQQWHKYLYFSGVWNSHGETGMKKFQLLVFGRPERLCGHFRSQCPAVTSGACGIRLFRYIYGDNWLIQYPLPIPQQ